MVLCRFLRDYGIDGNPFKAGDRLNLDLERALVLQNQDVVRVVEEEVRKSGTRFAGEGIVSGMMVPDEEADPKPSKLTSDSGAL